MRIMEWWNSPDSVSLAGTVAQILVALIGLVVLALGIRSSQLQNRQQQINELNIAEANAASAEANRGLEEAKLHAAELENKTAQAELELKRLQMSQAHVIEYSDEANLNREGSPITGGSVKFSTGLTKLLDRAKRSKDPKESEHIYLATIEAKPNFPFTYLYFAQFLKKQNDSRWEKYANEALRIFRITTSISHNTDHDAGLEDTKTLLEIKE